MTPSDTEQDPNDDDYETGDGSPSTGPLPGNVDDDDGDGGIGSVDATFADDSIVDFSDPPPNIIV